jgi:hypothetical protein
VRVRRSLRHRQITLRAIARMFRRRHANVPTLIGSYAAPCSHTSVNFGVPGRLSLRFRTRGL